MTDQPTERPVDIRVELTALLSVVDDNVSITREQMEAIGDHLQTLWGKAHDAHDDAALDIITSVWDRAQLLVEQNASLAFQVSGMGSIAVSALEGERATREALDNLEDAIDSNDDSHPKLQDFAETIREEAMEYLDERVSEELWPEAYEAAGEDISENYLDMITTITGCDWKAATHFKEMLDGWHKPTPEQVDLFKALMASFEESVRAASNGR
jgi:hypothetical protein